MVQNNNVHILYIKIAETGVIFRVSSTYGPDGESSRHHRWNQRYRIGRGQGFDPKWGVKSDRLWPEQL